jgi:PAS domain S-box-containing protein
MAPLARNEAGRLQALRSILHLTRQPDPSLDELARLAAEICGVPFAVVGFVDETTEWFKSRVGIPADSVERELGFCSVTVDAEELLVVNDASTDARFAGNPLVSAAPNIRFWAGVPLFHGGEPIGALGVMDRHPRQLSAAQGRALGVVGRQVVAHIALGDAAARAAKAAESAADYKELLRESEERFRDLFEHADDWVMSIGADGRILHTNRACLHALGYEEVARKSVYDLIDGNARSSFADVFDRVMLSGVAERIETVFITADGNAVTVEGGLNPKIVAERPVMARVIFRDISDRKRYEAELALARDAALESARLKSQFLTNVSHEIRTPMNGVVGMLDLLLDTPLTVEQTEYVKTALSSAESLLATINNILQISKLEAGKAAVTTGDFDLQKTVARVFEVMEVAALEKPLKLSLEVDPSLPLVLRGDVGKFRQALTNIVSNAVKFTSEGTVRLRVLRDRDTDTHALVRIEVKDTGPGIPDEVRPRLFEAFTQADGSTTREFGGIGLGLATARRLIELMGGVLGYESNAGLGTTVWFTIPFEKRPEGRHPKDALRNDLEGARVLLVDAGETTHKIIQHYLAEWRAIAESVATPNEALSRARRAAATGAPFDLAIFDLRMESLDGLEFAEAFRFDTSLAECALVMLVPLGQSVDETVWSSKGIARCAAKPIERSDLFDALSSALLGRALRAAQDPRTQGWPAPPPAAGVPIPPAAVSAPPLAVPPPAAPPPPLSSHVVAGVERAATPLENLPAAVPADLGARVRILLAEDNVLNQKVALMQLKKLGFEADAVGNGIEVMEALRRAKYDVILMDCQMPRMDGYEATREIRRREGSTRQVKIIAMTAHALEGDREKCLASGMDDYLSKPLKQDELIAALTRASAGVK